MHLKISVLLVLIFGILSGYGATAQAQSEQARKPNILFIMADDVGAECLPSYGGTSYETPHLDRLAAGGVRFANAYATPVCGPTRIELMSGKYPYKTGWLSNITKEDPRAYFDAHAHPTFAHLLKKAGYRTAVAGKWQLCRFHHRPDHALECGFDTYSLHTMWDEADRRTSPYWKPHIRENGALRKDTCLRFGADVFSGFLIDFMLEKDPRPFFAYYPMYLAHDPFIRTPDNIDEYGHRDYHMNFGGMIHYADRMIGKMIKALEAHNLLEETIIVFTTDNGTNRKFSSQWKGKEIHGGKARLNDNGTRVPFIVYWKDQIPPATICELIDFTDVYPTFADIADVRHELPNDLDGMSFWPQLFGREAKIRDWVFSQYQDDWYVRNKTWLIRKNGQIEDVSEKYHPKVLEGRVSDPELEELMHTARSFMKKL